MIVNFSYLLPVVNRITESGVLATRPLEIMVHIVVPVKRDAAMHLDAVIGDQLVIISAVSFSHRHRQRSDRIIILNSLKHLL